MSDARDPWLDLPLSGVRLIEASAGTGKTYTLATLATRLVVERGLRVGELLAVTFTEAATQELRKRIRERLQLTLEMLDAPAADATSPEAQLARDMLQGHLDRGGDTRDALRLRLRGAVLDIDLAAVFTIHGFCARVLREHALDAGHGFDASELLTDERALRTEVAADLWRAHGQDPDDADDLAALWPAGYPALADDLPDLLGRLELLPPDAPLPQDPMPALMAAGASLADAFRAHGDDFFAGVLAALDAKVLNGNSYRADWIHALHRELAAWCARADYASPLDERIARLTADYMRSKTNKGKEARVAESSLCAVIEAYVAAVDARKAYTAHRRANLLHRLRIDGRQRIDMLKRQRRVQTYDDLIDGVADALAGPHGDALARQLRQQYKVALVDEFQDTDARQWAIFERVFGAQSADPALFLIGDPKQAIYGFRGGDVHTYLQAARTAQEAPALAHNFRSRPSLLAAVNTLYGAAGEGAFVDTDIRFHPIEPGGKHEDGDYLRDGMPAPAVMLWRAPSPPADQKGWSADKSRALAADACVAAIHGVLSDARGGKALIKDKGSKALRAVQPGDIAVLVRWHGEATRIRQALALAGIPAVAAGRHSLFATDEARELHALLLALLNIGDDERLRAVLATVLLGKHAAEIAALDHDGDAQRLWHTQASLWEVRLQRGGPLALIGDLCAQNAERLLGLADGERRLSNYLQLAELLQEAQARETGLRALADWLGLRIANADANDETQLLRLESDAHRVQIVTLHKSKGLEYPLVFLPFVGVGRNDKTPSRHCAVHDGDSRARRLHWKLDLPEAKWEDASKAWKREQSAEDARLLYVGLTRAQHALWIATGIFHQSTKAALAKLLPGGDAALPAGSVAIDGRMPSGELPRLPPESVAAVPPARVVERVLDRDWWVYSFSQLSKADGGDASSAATLPAEGGNDEPEVADAVVVDDGFDPRFSGNRYGVALHSAFELADFAAWRDWTSRSPAPDAEHAVIAKALRGEGFGEDMLDDGTALSAQLIGNTLTVALPEGVRLCDVPESGRRPEIEFQFSLQAVNADALLQLLHAHGVVRDRHGFGQRHRLEGLMTGLIDLVYHHGGQWYVLDYKSNRLPAYDEASLAQAMGHSEYDLQALIYTLALHRWLRFRLGDRYDYARDFGGIRYLFCRGIDATKAHSPGIHAQRFPPELVRALDALFGHGTEKVAA